MTYQFQLVLIFVLVLGCSTPVCAGPDGYTGASHVPLWRQADAPGSFYAAGKIHQVLTAGPHIWLIADQNSGSTDSGPWLIRTDTEGVMQAGTSMRDIPKLDKDNNWSRTPLAATRSGGIAMLVQNEDKSSALLEFDETGNLIRHRGLDHLPKAIGGWLGLGFDNDDGLIIGSQKILRLNKDLEFVNSWAVDKDEYIVAYTMDWPAHITVVSVQKDEQGYRWVTRKLSTAAFTPSPAITVAKTASRHFLVDVFAPDSEHTVIVMPDIENNDGAWQLITSGATGKPATTTVRIPQDARKTHETRVFVEKTSVHFLSIDARQAWHTIVPIDNATRLKSQALRLPRSEFETTVTNVHAARAANRLYIGTNYRMAEGTQSINAAALLLVAKSRPDSP